MDDKRACPVCDKPLERRNRESWCNFALRVYCDRKCYAAALKQGMHNRRTGAVRK